MAKSDLTHFWHTLNWFDIVLTHFISKQNGKVRFDTFLTYSKLIWHSFDILLNFWNIFDMCQICVKTLLTLFWHTKYMSKLFLTHIWHIFDTFLTYKFLQGYVSMSWYWELYYKQISIFSYRTKSSKYILKYSGTGKLIFSLFPQILLKHKFRRNWLLS